MKRLIYLFMLFSGLSVVSCTAEPEQKIVFDSAVRQIDFPAEGGCEAVVVFIEGLESWDAYASESWIELTPDREKGILTVSADETEEVGDISGKVIIYSSLEETIEIEVDQKGWGVIYDRPTKSLMNLRGNVKEVDFWFSPKNMWMMQPQYLYNLVFNEKGMLTHYETNYTTDKRVDFYADLTYDGDNRLVRIDITSKGGASDYFPAALTVDFSYDDHGKYISTRNMFTIIDSWNCFIYPNVWMPKMIRDLSSVKLTSKFFEQFIGRDHVTLDIEVNGDEGQAWYTMTEERQGLFETYEFSGPYTSAMQYEIVFVGIYIPSWVTYEIRPESGYITRVQHRNDEVFGILEEERFDTNIRNTTSSYANNYQNYMRLTVEYNEYFDPVYSHNASQEATAKFGYVYDKAGNWTELEIEEMTKEPGQPLKTSRKITYYNN